MLDKTTFQLRLQKIDELVRTIEQAADPNIRASAVELMQSLMELYGNGFERMLEIVFDSGPDGAKVIDALADDDLVESLLLLHGLHPLDLETRVMLALDKVRPYLQSHKGNVDLIGIDEGVVRLKLQGSCDGCASSAMTLKLAIEEAIYEKAPDIVGLEVEGVVEERKPAGLVQLERAKDNKENARGWKEVNGLADLASGAVETIDVSGRPVLFCRVGESFYAYDNKCPDCGQTMQASSLDLTALSCPACRQRFDVMRAGRGLDKPGIHLEPFPLLMEQGQAKVALPAI
jgi:Fe-S cluster biogenesis protein NfuA/nitrite reductase/ring-hydroxylating ferredoxin subunit